MIRENTPNHYGTLAMAMHWLMFVLIVAVYAFIEFRDIFPKGSDPRQVMKDLHFMLGLTVFVLVSIRLWIRMKGNPIPNIEPELPVWQKVLAKMLHISLYAFMIAMPLLGWLLLSAAGKSIPFYGLELPSLIDKNKELAELIKEIHEILATVGYFLIGFHVLAALYHHYFKHDNTLIRILPIKTD